MSPTAGCPDAKTLEAALLGRTSALHLDLIAAHLAECQKCLEHSRTLALSDSWVDLLRRQHTLSSDADLPAFANELVVQLKSLTVSNALKDSKSFDETILRDTPNPAADRVNVRDERTSKNHGMPLDRKAALASRVPKKIGAGVGDTFGAYQILETIARGGMGVVFRARHTKLNREVALKMILSSQLAGPENIQRFYVEAEAAARLNHPGIVPIYEVGEENGQHFFSMALMDGGSLVGLVKDQPLEPQRAAQFLKLIADAVQYAHSRNIVHRDLKPANVLLDADGQPKVADFGLAKDIGDDSGLTASGQIMGTPDFMAPEQAAGRNDQVGPLADVYSLGAILYYLITRQPPCRGRNVVETLRQVIEKEPVSPRQLNSQVDSDLATICLKCLSKDPARRYASAAELGEELSRYIAGYPIKARPIGKGERAWRWCRRNPLIAGLGTVAIVLLLATATIATVGYLKETRLSEELEASLQKQRLATVEAKRQGAIAASERDRAVDAGKQATVERTNAQLGLANAHFDRAVTLFDKGDVPTALLFLARSLQVLPPDNAPLEDAIRRCLASWSDEIVEFPIRYFEHTAIPTCATFFPEGNRMAVGCRDGSIAIWDYSTGDVQTTVMNHPDAVHRVSVSVDGSRLLAGCVNGLVRLWNLSSQQQVGPDIQHAKRASTVNFTPDGKFALTGSWDGTTRFLSAETGMILRTSDLTPVWIFDVAISPDGKSQITYDTPGAVTVREIDTGKLVRQFNRPAVDHDAVGLSRDGRLLGLGDRNNEFRLLDFKTGKQIGQEYRYQGWVTCVAFNAESTRVLCGSRDNTVQLFDCQTARPLGTPLMHRAVVDDLEFAPRGDLCFTLSADQLRVWRPWSNQSEKSVKHLEAAIHDARYSTDGSRITVFSGEDNIQFYDADRMTPIGERVVLPKPVRNLAPDVGGQRALAVFADRKAGLVDLTSGQLVSRELQLDFEPKNANLHPDEDRFALAVGYSASIWSLSQGKAIVENLAHPNNVAALHFSPDGETLATACQDGIARFWNSKTGSPMRAPIDCESGAIRSLTYSDDGTRLAIAGMGKVTSVWNLATSERIAGPFFTLNLTRILAFDPLAAHLAAGGGAWNDGDGIHKHHLRVWSIPTNRPASRIFELPHNLSGACFSPDGGTLLTSCLDGNIRSWKLAPQPGTAAEIETWIELLTGMTLDSRNTFHFLNAQGWNRRTNPMKTSLIYSKQFLELNTFR